MIKKVLVISTSLRKGGNSDTLGHMAKNCKIANIFIFVNC